MLGATSLLTVRQLIQDRKSCQGQLYRIYNGALTISLDAAVMDQQTFMAEVFLIKHTSSASLKTDFIQTDRTTQG